jgi:phosphoglycolate phosphatase-like HAD superfamily hydrolase
LTQKRIFLDADGVLLDFNLAYATAWERAFGKYPNLKNPNAYWATDRWDVEQLNIESLFTFKKAFDESFWSNIPAIKGAIAACHALNQAGYELICVTALPGQFQPARLQNLVHLGFPIEFVFTVDHMESFESPKAAIINFFKPVAFVDDYLPYMTGINMDIHRALITRDPEMSPNEGPLMDGISSSHSNLEDFAKFWLARAP